MHQTPGPGDHGIDSDALLAAYQLLIETIAESGGDEAMLQRALVVLASIRWTAPHRFFSVLVPDADSASLHVAASVGGPAAQSLPCADRNAAACLCGRALARPGRLLCFDATTAKERLPCDPQGGGIHLVLPLTARGRALGVLHALVDSALQPGVPEQTFLVQVASLLGVELHLRHSEREHDRLEMQFLQAQKMEAVGRLAGGVAHDFNNILTAITSYADLGLLKLPAQSPLRRNFEEILTAADRAALLTQQLLAFSRRQVLAPKVIDLGAILGEVGKTLRRLLGPDIALSFSTDPGRALILADPALIEQLIINLMVSARDAMPQGGAIAVEAAATTLDAEHSLSHPTVTAGNYICLTVRTHGNEMAVAPVRTFWATGAAAGREAHTGAALGPAAVNDIIRQSGGHAVVSDDAGNWSTMRIYFPAVTADAASATAADATYLPPRGSETILLAEDDGSVRVVMVEVLRDLGYRVLEAREGSEALTLAAKHEGRIDVLVTDAVMPGLGGRELYRRIAATSPGLRVLYVSGAADDIPARSGLAEPDAAILLKPFSPWALAARLRQVLAAPPPAPRLD